MENQSYSNANKLINYLKNLNNVGLSDKSVNSILSEVFEDMITITDRYINNDAIISKLYELKNNTLFLQLLNNGIVKLDIYMMYSPERERLITYSLSECIDYCERWNSETLYCGIVGDNRHEVDVLAFEI